MLEADGVLYDDEMMRAARDRTQWQMIDHQTRMAAAGNPAGTTSVSEDIAALKNLEHPVVAYCPAVGPQHLPITRRGRLQRPRHS
jgi:hypothetical protein